MSLRTALRAPLRVPALARTAVTRTAIARSLSTSVVRRKDDGYDKHRVEATPSAKTDSSATFELPKTLPADPSVADHAAPHSKRTLPLFSMEGKVCVVTGAARGLGNMMARTFVESGATDIVILDLNEADASKAAAELTEWFVSEGQAARGEITALGLGCNVADEESVKAAFARVKEKFGRVDTLVTAAGIVENFAAHDYPTAKVRKLVDINIMGSWFCALEGARLMPDGGSVVLIGSMSGSIVNVPQPQAPYNMSKAAVRHMARSLAVEWAPQRIRVNCISPGYMLTPLTKVILDNDPALRDMWIDRTPFGRLGDPSDLKGAVVYFASDASKYTTGAELTVDGGYTCV